MTAGVVALAGLACLVVYQASVSLTISQNKQRLDEVTPPPDWSMPVLVSGGALLVAAVGIAMIGKARGRRKPPTPQAADLRPLIMAKEVPFTVCSSCRIIIDLPLAFSCPQCDQTDRCVRVEDDSERSFAISALGLAPDG